MLNTSKLKGLDNIQRLAGDGIIASLGSLYRYNIETKTDFANWKRAKIDPVFKKDDETDREQTRLLAKQPEKDPRILSKQCT